AAQGGVQARANLPRAEAARAVPTRLEPRHHLLPGKAEGDLPLAVLERHGDLQASEDLAALEVLCGDQVEEVRVVRHQEVLQNLPQLTICVDQRVELLGGLLIAAQQHG